MYIYIYIHTRNPFVVSGWFWLGLPTSRLCWGSRTSSTRDWPARCLYTHVYIHLSIYVHINNFKVLLGESEKFDPRLACKVPIHTCIYTSIYLCTYK